jgi:hypothetical protein
MKKLLLFLSIGLFLTGCGPRPEVKEKSFTRSVSHPGAYEVHALIENNCRGEGEAKVKAQLIDEKTHISYKEDKNLDLKSHEKSMAEILIHAPESQYQLEVEVEYPPQ